MTRNVLDATYYQALHDDNPAFQRNNWLIQDLEVLRVSGGTSLLELGCGNGRFLAVAAKHWSRILGIDWARSPYLDGVLREFPNVAFEQADISSWAPSQPFDLVASADFLEHLAPDDLEATLQRIHGFGHRHFHRIACYDDGHSHLSIFPPSHWLELFSRIAPGAYRLRTDEPRKGDAEKRVITIASF
jgi:2-polyprenyl-3-methyl-5-hydroxy-6-metoxy-1,4-benzoquinol methylase